MSTKKFLLMFSSLWLTITGFVTFVFYSVDELQVNGVPTSHEEFSQLLWPKLFFGIFWLVGLTMLYFAIKEVIKDSKTEKLGEECFGKVVSHTPTSTYVNGMPVVKANILVYVASKGITEEYAEEIGTNPNKYPVNSIVRLKLFEEDINIKEIVSQESVPTYVLDELRYNEKVGYDINSSIGFDENVDMSDEIVVNGVRYKKMD